MSQKKLEYYLKLDYKIMTEFIEDKEDGNYWTAEYVLLKGCKTEGAIKGEAISNVKELFEEYIIDRLMVDENIPEPVFIRLPVPVQELWIEIEPFTLDRKVNDDTIITLSDENIYFESASISLAQ